MLLLPSTRAALRAFRTGAEGGETPWPDREELWLLEASSDGPQMNGQLARPTPRQNRRFLLGSKGEQRMEGRAKRKKVLSVSSARRE